MSVQDLELVHPVAGAEPPSEVPVSGHHRRGQRHLQRWVFLEKTPLCVELLAQVCPLLASLGIDGYFAATVSGDTLEVKKPPPGPLLHAAETLQVDIRGCLYVGDSAADRDAAQAAGATLVRVPYGYPGDDAIFAGHPAALTLTIEALAERLADLAARREHTG